MSRAGRDVGPSVSLVAPLFCKALVERTKIDHDSLVGSAADLLYAVACRHLEVNSFSLDVDYLGRRAHLVTYRRGGEVLYIYCKVRPARSFRRLRNAEPISAPGVQMPPSPCTSRTRQRALSAIILLVEP